MFIEFNSRHHLSTNLVYYFPPILFLYSRMNSNHLTILFYWNQLYRRQIRMESTLNLLLLLTRIRPNYLHYRFQSWNYQSSQKFKTRFLLISYRLMIHIYILSPVVISFLILHLCGALSIWIKFSKLDR